MQPQPQPQPTPQSGVSSCYVFKSRLQEYAQKVGLPTPVYETSKEGPSHEPTFRSTVIVNDVRYDSLLGFFNRKAAEQSAAEVALLALSKNSEVSNGISPPVHETGLCKNLLQEYAQKMNYAIPLYECEKEESKGRVTLFSCTVEIGGIRYMGAAARTKKEAEIKAARTALLAIQTSDASSNVSVNTDLTVLPCKKRGPETLKTEDAINPPKAKKARFKKKQSKKQMKFKTGLNNDKLKIADEPNVSGTNAAVEPQVAASTVAVPEETQFQLKASNFKSGLNDNKLEIAEEPNVSGTNAVEPQISGMEVEPQVAALTEAVPEKTQFQLKASNFKSGLNDTKLEVAEEPDVSKTDAMESQISGTEVETQVAAPTEGVPEKTQCQLKASNFKSGLNDTKLEVAEEPNVSKTDAMESQVAAPSEAVANVNGSQADGCGGSFIGEVKEVAAVPNLPTGNGNYKESGSEAIMPPSLNVGNQCEAKEEIAVVGEVAPMCQMSDLEQKIVVERMQAASDTA